MDLKEREGVRAKNPEPGKIRNLENRMSEHEKISSRTQHFSGYFPDFAHCAAPEGCRRGRASVVDGGRGQQHRGGIVSVGGGCQQQHPELHWEFEPNRKCGFPDSQIQVFDLDPKTLPSFALSRGNRREKIHRKCKNIMTNWNFSRFPKRFQFFRKKNEKLFGSPRTHVFVF